MARRTWIAQRVAAFIDEATLHGLTTDPAAIDILIRDRVTEMAEQLGVTERTAKLDLTDDVIRRWARDAARPLAAEIPGSSLLVLPPTHTIRVGLFGHTVAALGISLDLALTANDTFAAHEIDDLLVQWGAMLQRCDTDGVETIAAAVPLPEAGIHRALRILRDTHTRLTSGTGPSDGGNPVALARSVALNIEKLERELV